MSMNFAVSSSISSAHAFTAASLGDAAAGHGAGATATMSDSDDNLRYCGTPGPGHPPHSLVSQLGDAHSKIALNPQPLPPAEQSLGAHAGVKSDFDDGGWCGTVPHKLPHFPPSPPPGPWGDLVSSALMNAR